MDKEFNLIEVVRTLLKWRIPLLIITIIAAVASAIFSVFIMDEYYLSWSTFYPTNQSVFDRSSMFNSESGVTIDYFGGKGDANRVLTIANSFPVIQHVIDSFHLAQHYEIDTTSKYWATKVRKKFEKNYEAIKTENEAIKISLFDTDPKLGAAIVNTIVNEVDQLNKLQVATTKKRQYDAIGGQIARYQQDLANFVDTLALLGEQYKIKVGSSADGTVIVEGNNYKAVQNYKAIMARQAGISKEMNNLVNIHGQMEVSLENKESSLFILEQAFPSDKREKPVRSVVVVITTFLTLFISIIAVLLIEQFKEIKRQL